MRIISFDTTSTRAAVACGIGPSTIYRAAIAKIAIASILQRLLTEIAAAGAVVGRGAGLWLTAAQAHGTTVDSMACGVHAQLANAVCDSLAGESIQLFNIFTHVAATRCFAPSEFHLLYQTGTG